MQPSAPQLRLFKKKTLKTKTDENENISFDALPLAKRHAVHGKFPRFKR